MRYNRADWEMLKQWAVEGLVRVLYLDESGFEKASPLTYSYQDLRTCDEFSGFRTISRGRSPREIVQLRKS